MCVSSYQENIMGIYVHVRIVYLLTCMYDSAFHLLSDVCTDLFFDKWEKIAHSAGFSTEEVHQLMSGNPSDKKEQGRAFLHKWSQKSGWDMLKEIPFALENMDKGKTANRVVQDVFGM